MAEKILMLEQVNLFQGDHDPEASNHLKLMSLALPTIERVTVAHLGGGASAEVNWSVNAYRPMEPTFKLAGFSRESYRAIAEDQPENHTGYGIIRNKQTGVQYQAKTVMRGVIGRVAPDAFDRASAFGHDHAITEFTHYELHIGGEEWFFWDYFTSVRRTFGTDNLTRARTMLGVQ